MTGNTRILQYWEPEQLTEDSIKNGLVQIVSQLLGPFSCSWWTIRKPGHVYEETTLRWHTDGPNELYSINWSNDLPTEFQGFEAGKGDIILVRNLEFLHRTPLKRMGWFAQFYEIRPAGYNKLGKRFK